MAAVHVASGVGLQSPGQSPKAVASTFSFKDAASVGRHILLAALSHKFLDAVPGGRPKQACEVITGHTEYPLPASESSWSECFRDLARTLQGGSTFIIGRQRLYPVRGAPGAPGDVNASACNAAFEVLCQAMQDELAAQGAGLSAAGDLGEASGAHPIDGRAVRALARQAAVHICIGPGLQTVTQTGLPSALWQPLYAVCVGGGQVRVMTFAFVGEPVVGDRPDRKRTSRVLRLATEDLAVAARRALSSGTDARTTTVTHVIEPADNGAQFILDHIVSLEDELFRAIKTGHWSGLSRRPPTMEAPRMPSSPAARPQEPCNYACRAGLKHGISGLGGL